VLDYDGWHGWAIILLCMPYAITLRLNAEITPAVEAMWHALAAAEFDQDRGQLGYAPHITLAIYPDDVPATLLRAAVEAVACCWTVLPITLAGFGVFPGASSILWVVPVVTPALLDRHATLLAALPALLPHPHYRISAWVPHVTLSGTLLDLSGALAALLPHWRPLTGTLDQVDLVRFHPVEVLWSRPLSQ